MGPVQSASAGKAKLSYMAPEQLSGGTVTRQADVYAASVVIWEALTGYRLFPGEHEAAIVTAVLEQPVLPPSKLAPDIPAAFDQIVMRGLERNPANRYATARDMALELERYTASALTPEVGEWVESLVGDELTRRALLIAEVESARIIEPAEQFPEVHPVALTAPLPSPSHARRRVALVGVLVVGLVCVVVLLLAAGSRARAPAVATFQPTPNVRPAQPSAEPTAAPKPLQALSAPLVGDAAEPAAPAASITVEPVGPEPPGTEAPPASITVEPAVPEPPGEASEQPARAPKPRPHAVTKRTKLNCSTPFTIDDKGHKHYKAACL
jgi:hypothetical protein